MIGVVVWSNKGREQAVIWCDDHAALAYLVGRDHFFGDDGWPEPGDLVELKDEVQGDLRYARAVRPLSDSPVTGLPNMLSGSEFPRGQVTVLKGADRPQAEILPMVRRRAG